MDEYQLEIQQLTRKLAQLRDAEADPALIAEYEVELRNLNALYRASRETYDVGMADRRLAEALHRVGFGAWTLENVYSFVYDISMELPLDGQDLAALVDATDYAGSLLESLGG
ncbi:MAG TPA: hypothetical protein VF155_00350 [Candidatus Dormibacteraeota bacterium]